MNKDGLLTAYEHEIAALKKERDEAQVKCAEMREAFKGFECTICDKDHKFKGECMACLSGQPSTCTCDNEPLVDCPCCMEGEYAESYKKLRHALSSDCGKGWKSPEQFAEAIKPTIELLSGMLKDGFISLGIYWGGEAKAELARLEKLMAPK